MLSHDDRSRLEQIESMLRADDPILDRALQQGRPRAPREYRRTRLQILTYATLIAVALALSVATSRWPVVSGGCVLTAIALGLAADLAGIRTSRDWPVPRRRKWRDDP